MSIINRRNVLSLAIVGLATLCSPVEAQYYGYRRRRSGWRNIYLLAILIPIAFIALCALFWICIFRAIFRRRRERRNGGLPTTNSYNNNTSTLPSAYGQTYGNNNDSYSYGQNNYGNNNYGNNTSYQPPSSPYPVASNNGGEANSYYNSGNGPQYPQQAYGGNQQGYAPPAGPPPKR